MMESKDMKMLFKIVAATSACGFVTLHPAAANAQRGQRDPTQLLERADANGDGRITRSEYVDARARMFDRLDRNQNGIIDKDDMPKRRLARRSGSGQRLEQAKDMMDVDGDGRVTRVEFVDGPAPMFDRADTDRDGIVNQTELAALRQAIAARRAQ